MTSQKEKIRNGQIKLSQNAMSYENTKIQHLVILDS